MLDDYSVVLDDYSWMIVGLVWDDGSLWSWKNLVYDSEYDLFLEME